MARESDTLLNFIQSPIPYGRVQMCRILRLKKNSKCSFDLFLDGNSTTAEICILTAKKIIKGSLLSEYRIFLKGKPGSSSTLGPIVAIVRSNFWGTGFEITATSCSCSNESCQNATLPTTKNVGCVLYRPNFLGIHGPRQMKILFPYLDMRPHSSSNNKISCSSSFFHSSFDPTFLSLYKKNLLKNNVLLLKNKQPTWSDGSFLYPFYSIEHQSHVLNFHGRVSHPSVKNFQLVHPSEDSHIIMQFGRIGKDMFIMDIRYPMSLVQAFSIALTSFAFKLACE